MTCQALHLLQGMQQPKWIFGLQRDELHHLTDLSVLDCFMILPELRTKTERETHQYFTSLHLVQVLLAAWLQMGQIELMLRCNGAAGGMSQGD